jgi:outer membrane receptor for monomeric catechols
MLETGRYSTERKVVDVLRRVPGVVHTGERPDGGYAYLRGPQMAMQDTAFCHAFFFVDGMPQGTGLQPLSTYDVEAVEVYVGPSQVPAQYTVMGSMCGVVLIWTRTGTGRE